MDALRRALDSIRQHEREVDQTWCLGDLIGSVAPNETVELAVASCDVVLVGNHDLVAIKKLHEAYVATHGGPAMLALRGQLSPATRRILEGLPIFFAGMGCAATHACIDHPTARMMDGYEAESQLALIAERFLVVGHSHLPFFYDDARREWVDDAEDRDLIFDGRAVICPGSVLDVPHAPASYSVLDTESGRSSWHRVGS